MRKWNRAQTNAGSFLEADSLANELLREVLVGRRWVKARRANSPEEGWGGVKPLAGNLVYIVAEGKNANDKKRKIRKNREEIL
jgi:hypothetical protein